MHDLTGFQRDLIYTISGIEEPYGLAIKGVVAEYRQEEVNHGRLYPNLDTLVEKGYVDKQSKDKRTNLYLSLLWRRLLVSHTAASRMLFRASSPGFLKTSRRS